MANLIPQLDYTMMCTNSKTYALVCLEEDL